MKRVLIVVSSFPPAMIADMHRARMLCDELPRVGWAPEVLSPHPDYYRPDCIEPESVAVLPDGLPVHYADPDPLLLRKLVGARMKHWRLLYPMWLKGGKLLRAGGFDLVFISTTTFLIFCLGRLWKRQTGVPYVLDLQDPWYHPSRGNGAAGLTWKGRVNSWLAPHLERFAMRGAGGLVVVSPTYGRTYEARHADRPWSCLTRDNIVSIPFAASVRDFDSLAAHPQPQGVFRRDDGCLHVVYVGAGGRIMRPAFAAVCEAIQALRAQGNEAVDTLRLHLLGTMYGWREGDRRILQDVAERYGVGKLVEERPARVAYFRALQLAQEAHGLLVLGVDDEAYVPSKLFTYALTGKPLLAALHEASPALRFFEGRNALGCAMTFGSARALSLAERCRMLSRFLDNMASGAVADRPDPALADYLAPAMARRHADLFARCVGS